MSLFDLINYQISSISSAEEISRIPQPILDHLGNKFNNDADAIYAANDEKLLKELRHSLLYWDETPSERIRRRIRNFLTGKWNELV